jgi:hypothetical protein
MSRGFYVGFAAFVIAVSPTVLGLPASPIPDPEPPQDLPLTSLQAPCKLERRWFGTVPMLSWSIWLRCDAVELLVVHPWNLIGKVRVLSGEQALEFVRFFSSEGSYASLQMDGLLEVKSTNPWCPPLPAALGQGVTVEPEVESHEGDDDARYYVRRYVVSYDQNVYRITEAVRRDGFYTEIHRSLVLGELSKLGCLHEAP